jgi:soluble lytic murein transglycosylase
LQHVADLLARIAVQLELARQLERNEDYRSAASYQTLLADSFPKHQAAANALLRAGINRYRLNEISAALTLWQRGLKAYPAASDAPMMRLWLGKGLLAQRKRADAAAAWQTLIAQAPESYAGLRARALALQAGLPLTVIPPLNGEATRAGQGDDGSQAFAERWLRTWIKTGSAATDLTSLDQRIRSDRDWQRGQAYLDLRLRGPALEALELVRARYWNDPLLVYQLAVAFEELGTYRLSVISAARVIALAPNKLVSAAPLFIQRLAYPTYFEDVVTEEAARFGLDPMLIYAMIRQESLFEPGAESSAAARGLMQVIPSTGRWIAGELGFADFHESDLYRPWISVKFGAFYTMRGLRAANGSTATALAGYNAGPGNAKIWRERSGPDEDLFYETISITEPRSYLSLITTHFAHYTRLYGSR